MAPKRGGLSLARKKELQNLFHSADTDASGLLSFTEMKMVLREGNPSLTDKELALLFREIDTNGDLTVDFKEFARYLNSMSASKLKKSKSREQVTADRCKEEFWRVDENSDGTLSRGEMTLLLRKGNPEITEEELELLFDTMDQDGNGSLDFSEFVDYITGAKAQGEAEPEKEEKFSDTIFWVDTVPLPEVYQQRSSHIAMAHERAIYRPQLDELMKLIKEVLEAVSISEGTRRLTWGSLNMYQASEHFLKPLTQRFDPCSFVEPVAAEPQVPEWFVSHWWGTPLVQTFAMLKYHQEQREGEAGEASAWWIDSFARCLHCVQPTRFPAPKDLEDAAFCKVLISTTCVGSVVLLDSSGMAFSRAWCLLEFALSLDMPKDKSTGHVTDVVAWNHPLKKAGLLFDVGQGKSEEVLREGAVFPLDLYSKGYRVAVHKSEASLEADRKRILHFLASTPADSWDRLKPPTDKEAYSTVNASLQQRFIAGAMAASAMADDEKALKKMATDHPEYLESCTAHGFRPVHAAAMKGSLQALKLLVGLQCNVNARATDGRTPLYLAAREGHDATVLYLLKNKAEVDTTSSGGKTALHASIEGGHITISGSLLDHKANPNISAGAEAPLLLAARDDQAATCGLLLDFKADPSKESAEGEKCYELVKHSTKLVETLKKAVQDAQGGGATRSSRRRPSVGEERMVRDLSAICSKEVKGSRMRP